MADLATGGADEALSFGVDGCEVGRDVEASAPAPEIFSELEGAEPANFSMRRRRIYEKVTKISHGEL